MITILAQIISIFAAAFNIFSYQMKDNRRLFLSKGISGALFAVNFILLGNFTAGALNAVNLADFLADSRKISFDMVVKVMYETGKNLLSDYRETASGGLAKHYVKKDK